MTVSSEINRVSYNGNGSTTEFSFPRLFYDESDLTVIAVAADGTEVVKTITTHYTVAGEGDPAGGTVTMLVAPASGTRLVIIREVPFTQDLDLVEGDPFPPDSVEESIDRAVMMAGQNKEVNDRSLRFPRGDSTSLVSELPPAIDRADKIPAFDADGNVVVSTMTLEEIEEGATDAAASAVAAAASASAAATSASAASSSASAASTSATNAATSETNAAASALAAAASAGAGMYDGVQNKSANFNIVAADEGDLFRVDTSGGGVTATLDTIANLGDFKIAVAKLTGDANTVTITRGGSNTINGATSYTLDSQYESVTLISKSGTTDWLAIGGGASASGFSAPDVFSGDGVDTTFTLSRDPGTENNLLVAVSGVLQQRGSYSVSGTTLTFSSAPANLANNIEVTYLGGIALDIGAPSDGSVTPAKIASGNEAAFRSAFGAAGTSQVFDIPGLILTPADGDYKIVVKAGFAGSITETTTICASGTATATFKINSTALGGTANSVSSAEQSQAHASNNAFVAGDDIVITISSNSSCSKMSYNIKYTRTLA